MVAYRRVHDMYVCVAVCLVGGGGSPPPGPWPYMLSPAGWLPTVRDQLRAPTLDYEYGYLYLYLTLPESFRVPSSRHTDSNDVQLCWNARNARQQTSQKKMLTTTVSTAILKNRPSMSRLIKSPYRNLPNEYGKCSGGTNIPSNYNTKHGGSNPPLERWCKRTAVSFCF